MSAEAPHLAYEPKPPIVAIPQLNAADKELIYKYIRRKESGDYDITYEETNRFRTRKSLAFLSFFLLGEADRETIVRHITEQSLLPHEVVEAAWIFTSRYPIAAAELMRKEIPSSERFAEMFIQRVQGETPRPEDELDFTKMQ